MWLKLPGLPLPFGLTFCITWRKSVQNKIRLWVLCDSVNKTKQILMTFYTLCCSGPLEQLSKAHAWQMSSSQPQVSQLQMGQLVAIFKLQRISADFCRIFRSSKCSASTKARCFLRFSLFFFNWEIWSLYKWDEITKKLDYLIQYMNRKFVKSLSVVEILWTMSK